MRRLWDVEPQPKDIREYLDNAYLGLGDTSKIVIPNANPFASRNDYEIENPHIFLIDYMRKPENFGFTCKHLFNIDLAPFQLAILWELWYRPFPMFIGSRGLSKSFMLALYSLLRATFNQGSKIVVVGAAFRQAKVVFEYCETIWNNAPVFRDFVGDHLHNGPRRDIDRCVFRIGQSIITALPLGDGCVSPCTQTTYVDSFGTISEDSDDEGIVLRDRMIYGSGEFHLSDESYYNGKKPTKVVKTRKGYEYEGTFNHKMKVCRENNIVFVRTDEMKIGDHILIDRSYRWHDGNSNVTKEQSYALGLMIGDGCWTQSRRLGYATQDKELIEGLRVGTGLNFKQASDKQHYWEEGQESREDWLNFWGLKTSYAKDKHLPKKILSASRDCMSACIRGLFDTDGHINIGKSKGGITIGFTNTSKKLIYQLQYILLHYGIITYVKSRERNERWNTVYELLITGQDVVRFNKEIGFGLTRKQNVLECAIQNKLTNHTISDNVPVKGLMLEIAEEFKTQDYGVCYKKIFVKKTITREYISRFLDAFAYTNDTRLLKIKELASSDIYYDEVVSIKNSECETYDVHVPRTHEYCANGFYSHNTKIRGQRASHLIAEEFASLPEEIYENVVAGFAAVSASPILNLKNKARIKVLKSLGMWSTDLEDELANNHKGNQAILSGTAYYQFNHFYKYWRRYKAIIETKGDNRKLEEIFNGEIPAGFDWKDYSVIRIPVDMLPDGFMDEKHVARSKATVHSGIYAMEFGATFTGDSNGFFKRLLIESCVVGHNNPIELPSCGRVKFNAVLRGNPGKKYVMSIDPASEKDNFSITILEIWPDHRRIVYCWTITRNRHKNKLKKGLVEEQDFYSYAARKIRDLLKLFNVQRISIDSQGGGIAIIEALADKDRLKEGESKILPLIEKDKPKDTDGEAGLHILEIVQFADAKYVAEANHGMRKDFEDKVLLFPEFNSAVIGLAIEDDKMAGRVVAADDSSIDLDQKIYDTLEDAVMEIEEMKDELATIVHTQTATSGRDRWDTPEVKLVGGKKGRLRKDRYSSLLMANMTARILQREPVEEGYEGCGGFAKGYVGVKTNVGPGWTGPAWFIEQVGNIRNYGASVTRSV